MCSYRLILAVNEESRVAIDDDFDDNVDEDTVDYMWKVLYW